MTRNHWAMVAVVLGAVLVWIAVSWTPAREQPAPAPAAVVATEPQAPPAVAPAVEPRPAPAPSPANPAPAQPQAPVAQEAPALNPQANIQSPAPSGPIDEYKHLFASEPRASNASDMESRIEGPFRRPEVLPGTFKSVICRTTVCRVETRWSPDRAAGFLSAMMRVVTDRTAEQGPVNQGVAISPEGEPGPDRSRVIDVYFKRLPPNGQAPTPVPAPTPAAPNPPQTQP